MFVWVASTLNPNEGLKHAVGALRPLALIDGADVEIHQAARGIIAQTPVELPLMQSVAADTPAMAAPISGMELPVVQAGG